jgi:hypothetical protein
MRSAGVSSAPREVMCPDGGVGVKRSIIVDGVLRFGGSHFGLFRMEENSSVMFVWNNDSFDMGETI